MTPAPVVFLLDVDNTLLDNDRVAADLRDYLTRADPAPALGGWLTGALARGHQAGMWRAGAVTSA